MKTRHMQQHISSSSSSSRSGSGFKIARAIVSTAVVAALLVLAGVYLAHTATRAAVSDSRRALQQQQQGPSNEELLRQLREMEKLIQSRSEATFTPPISPVRHEVDGAAPTAAAAGNDRAQAAAVEKPPQQDHPAGAAAAAAAEETERQAAEKQKAAAEEVLQALIEVQHFRKKKPKQISGFFRWIPGRKNSAHSEDVFLPFTVDADAFSLFWGRRAREASDRASVSNTRLVNSADFDSDWYSTTLQALLLGKHVHRKQWEFCTIWRAVTSMLNFSHGHSNVTLFGFGVGTEPLPSAFVAHGAAHVVASDMPLEMAGAKLWQNGQQHTDGLDKTYKREFFLDERGKEDEKKYFSKASFRSVDMANIPEDLKRAQFSAVWSSSAVEHLGTLQRVADFLVDTARMLKPGGVSVHTSEFLVSSLRIKLEMPGVFSLLRLGDVEHIAERLEREVDARMTTRDYFSGNGPLDVRCDAPPYHSHDHMKLYRHDRVGGTAKRPTFADLCHTSILIVIVKNKKS